MTHFHNQIQRFFMIDFKFTFYNVVDILLTCIQQNSMVWLEHDQTIMSNIQGDNVKLY